MSARTGRGRPGTLLGGLLSAWLRACTVPGAQTGSPLATLPEAAFAAARR